MTVGERARTRTHMHMQSEASEAAACLALPAVRLTHHGSRAEAFLAGRHSQRGLSRALVWGVVRIAAQLQLSQHPIVKIRMYCTALCAAGAHGLEGHTDLVAWWHFNEPDADPGKLRHGRRPALTSAVAMSACTRVSPPCKEARVVLHPCMRACMDGPPGDGACWSAHALAPVHPATRPWGTVYAPVRCGNAHEALLQRCS